MASKLGKGTVIILFFILSTLPNHTGIGNTVGTKEYSNIVSVGNSFVWYVDTYDVTSVIKPESETALKKNDKIEVTIIKEPELEIVDIEDVFEGITGIDCVNYTVNDHYFNSTDTFHYMPYPFYDGWIYAISFQGIDAQGCTNFMELMQDMFEEPEEGISVITNELTESYYELEYTYETALEKGYIRKKYDRDTGILLVSHEDVELYAIGSDDVLLVSADILLVYEDEKTSTTDFSLLVLVLCFQLITIFLNRWQKKKKN